MLDTSAPASARAHARKLIRTSTNTRTRDAMARVRVLWLHGLQLSGAKGPSHSIAAARHPPRGPLGARGQCRWMTARVLAEEDEEMSCTPGFFHVRHSSVNRRLLTLPWLGAVVAARPLDLTPHIQLSR
jgi:hypothetical protein